MNISFPIVNYTEAQSIEELTNGNNDLNSLPISPQSSKEEVKLKKSILILIGNIIFFMLMFWGFYTLGNKSAINLILGAIIAILILLLFVFVVELSSQIGMRKHILKSFKYFNQNLYFSVDSITIVSPLKAANLHFFYEEIADFVLLFKPHKDENLKGNIAIFSWESSNKRNEYVLPIQSTTEKEQLIEVLKYLYDKEMIIKEYNDKGEKTHLLKSIKPLEFEEKYLDLIDEIGDKEDKH